MTWEDVMAIPDPIKTNFHTLGKAFERGDIALLECRDRSTGAPAYAICAINILLTHPSLEVAPDAVARATIE